jgi:hypothetical protein
MLSMIASLAPLGPSGKINDADGDDLPSRSVAVYRHQA